MRGINTKSKAHFNNLIQGRIGNYFALLDGRFKQILGRMKNR